MSETLPSRRPPEIVCAALLSPWQGGLAEQPAVHLPPPLVEAVSELPRRVLHAVSAVMKAALLPDRGVIKVIGDDARKFLHGLVTADVLDLTPGTARFRALLTPQGKIIADFLATEAPQAEGGGFFLDIPRALAATLVEK